MIEPLSFIKALQAIGVQFVTGVPDSLLKDVCAAITEKLDKNNHIIASNEGSAIGLAIGHFLGTGIPSLVYMQNSGLGNTVNPLTSLADPEIYSIPMILMIGWRGEMLPNNTQLKDEPQHVKQGQVTLKQLEVLDIPYQIMDAKTDVYACLNDVLALAIQRSGPVAIVIRKGTFSAYHYRDSRNDTHTLSREQAIHQIVQALPDNIPVVSTTGMLSRELFELRKANNSGHHRDFLTVGGMGHASSIATGISIAKPDRKVVCLDGDGATLMHMGALAISAERKNIIHIVLNNGSHDSVGGQPTRAAQISLANVAQSCGYEWVQSVENSVNISSAIERMLSHQGSCFLEIKCRRGNRADLSRPNRTPKENRQELMAFLGIPNE